MNHTLPMVLNAFAAGVALMVAIDATQRGQNEKWIFMILTATNLIFMVINWRLG